MAWATCGLASRRRRAGLLPPGQGVGRSGPADRTRLHSLRCHGGSSPVLDRLLRECESRRVLALSRGTLGAPSTDTRDSSPNWFVESRAKDVNRTRVGLRSGSPLQAAPGRQASQQVRSRALGPHARAARRPSPVPRVVAHRACHTTRKAMRQGNGRCRSSMQECSELGGLRYPGRRRALRSLATRQTGHPPPAPSCARSS